MASTPPSRLAVPPVSSCHHAIVPMSPCRHAFRTSARILYKHSIRNGYAQRYTYTYDAKALLPFRACKQLAYTKKTRGQVYVLSYDTCTRYVHQLTCEIRLVTGAYERSRSVVYIYIPSLTTAGIDRSVA